jgi:uncharacterized protein
MNTLEILYATVGHSRITPRKNSFTYKLFYLVTPITKECVSTPFGLSLDRFNILSIYTKDHGAHDESAWREWIESQCKDRGIPVSTDDDIVLISHPRFFGYVFNPISFWLILEKRSHLKAVLCEVRNTFGDNHNYLLAHDDGRKIQATDVFTSPKGLYVSPFNNMDGGRYKFSFDVTPQTFKTSIQYFEHDSRILQVYMSGNRVPLSTVRLFGAVLRYPLMTLAIIFRIHVQAVRLYFKGVENTLADRPQPTAGQTTRGKSEKET